MNGDELSLLRALVDVALNAANASIDTAGEPAFEGDVARVFEEAAREAIESRLKELQLPLLLLMEDGRPVRLGRGAPTARLIIDPVDGRGNFARGLPFSALSTFSGAAVPPAGPLAPATVRAALIRPLAGAQVTFVADGQGARAEWREGSEALRVSTVERLEEAMISVELDHFAPGLPLAEVIQTAHGVRATGSCSAALLAVACGQMDAHVDIRARLTAESWLAGAAMIRAAGGVVVLLDEALEQAAPPANMLERRSIVAAASRPLLEDILARLRKIFL